MNERACEKCGETVSAAKAFCPACGHAFVEEEVREQATEFQQLDRTMQVGKTMYNQMLSEMGLNISVPSDQLTEAVKPILAELSPKAPPSPQQPKAEVIKPITSEVPASAAGANIPQRRDRTKLLLIIGGVIIAGWILVLLFIGFFAILPRLR